jgi:hypothetical protein
MEQSTTSLIRFGHPIPIAFCQYNLGTCCHNMMLNLDVLRSVGISCKLYEIAHYALVPQQIILLILKLQFRFYIYRQLHMLGP